MRVYALMDPGDRRVRYVGITRAALETRLRHHVENPVNSDMREWMDYLKRNGKEPAIELLTWAPDDDWERFERSWILFFARRGLLLNRDPGGVCRDDTGALTEEGAKLLKQFNEQRVPLHLWRDRIIAAFKVINAKKRTAIFRTKRPSMAVDPMLWWGIEKERRCPVCKRSAKPRLCLLCTGAKAPPQKMWQARKAQAKFDGVSKKHKAKHRRQWREESPKMPPATPWKPLPPESIDPIVRKRARVSTP